MGEKSLTAQQVVSLLGSVAFRLAAPDVARSALLGALTDAGLEEFAPAVLKQKAPADAGEHEEAGGKKKRKRGKGGQGEDGTPSEGGKKARKPRNLSLMNLYMPFIFDLITKDPHHPAFKVPTKVDEDGKEVQVRGGHMTTASACWKALTEQDKARFSELVSPFMKTINEAISADEGKPDHLLDKLKAYLAEHKADKEVTKIINRSVEAATGFNPAKPSGIAPAPGSASKTAAGKPSSNGAVAAAGAGGKGGKGEAAATSKDKKGAAPAAGSSKADAKATAKQQEALKKQKEEEERKRKQQEEEDDDEDSSDDDDDDDE